MKCKFLYINLKGGAVKNKTIMPLRECSIAYFLKVLIMEIGLHDLSDNRFCQIFDQHPEWMPVFFGPESNFNPPPIAYIEPNSFCELGIKNAWMWKMVDIAQTNGNKLCFDESQMKAIPATYFQDRINDPATSFSEAINIYLWLATAVRDCGLSVDLNKSSFSYHKGIKKIEPPVNPLAEVDPTKVGEMVLSFFRLTTNWNQVVKKMEGEFPTLNIVHLREWVRSNLSLLGDFQADHLRPLFGLVPRRDITVDSTLWINGKPPELPNAQMSIPNKGQVEHACGLKITQATMDAIMLYCFETSLPEKEVFSKGYDPMKIETLSQQIGISAGLYMILVRYFRGSVEPERVLQT